MTVCKDCRESFIVECKEVKRCVCNKYAMIVMPTDSCKEKTNLENGCMFCSDIFSDLPREEGGRNIDVWLDEFKDEWNLVAHDREYGSSNYFQINYCPICGRKLV